ncbi:MAG TPA: ribose-phosphate diphosphokinase [Candidatus Saccharimonadales bacterium]|nr:ribose-phosphate diphosphokinase [Candidatus Saccharimonadales bacterium]
MDTEVIIKTASGAERVSVLFSEFPDQDSHCVVEDCDKVADKPVLIMHSLYPDQNNQLVKLVLLLSALKDAGAVSVAVFVPYLPYSRQDKKHVAGEAVSLDVVLSFMANAGCDQLYTIDCHFMKGAAQCERAGLSIKNFSAGKRLLDHCRSVLSNEDLQIIGPDEGAKYLLDGTRSGHMKKLRGGYGELAKGNSYRKIAELKSEHLDITCGDIVIVDDMISTGSTLIKAIDNLKNQGAKNISCVASHGLFIGDAYQKINKLCSNIVVSDTINHLKSVPVVDDLLIEKIIPDWFKLDPASTDHTRI